ncbi:MAG: AAA family ATPase [Bacteroidia bacterium]|nr:AAA family ATPase [Bacteroidia bacterium]
MRLRALELRGFKSFAERVKLPLDARLIGIVGPNGCGKSNIADALRWIMGEQKGKLLRIEKADNLIFNGSQHRKPLPFAEVTLEIEDFSPELPHLSFTRRVHRNGESEYFLNGTVARLKDFFQYFWQIGLTPQSILDGGQVEALIQDRGGARRALIESLAGIERYHHYKKELLTELEKTEAALSEIDRILAELRQQIQAFSAQAEKVAEYYKLKAAYRDLLSEWIAQELSSLSEAEKNLTKEAQSHQAALETLREEIEQLDERVRSMENKEGQLESQTLEGAYTTLRHELQSILQVEARLHERIRLLEQQITEVAEEKCLRLRQKTELVQEEESLRHKREAAEQILLEKREALSKALARLRQEEQRVNEIERGLREKSHDYRRMETLLMQLQRQKAETEAALHPLQERLRAIDKELQALRERRSYLLHEKENHQLQIHSLQAKHQEVQQTLRDLVTQRETLLAQRQSLSKQLQDVENRLQALKVERDTLEALLNRSDSWPSYLKQLRALGVDFWRTEDIFFAEGEALKRLGLLMRLLPPTLWVKHQEEAERIHTFLCTQKEGFLAVRMYKNQEASPHSDSDKVQTLEGFEGLESYLWKQILGGHELPTFSPDGPALILPDGRIYFFSDIPTQHIGLPHRIRRIEMEMSESEQALVDLQAEVHRIDQAVAGLPIAIHQREKETLTQALHTAEKALSITEARLDDVEQRRSSLIREQEQLMIKQSALLKKLETIEPQLTEAQTHFAALKTETQSMEAQQTQLRQAHAGLQKEAERLRLALMESENELKSTENAYKLILRQLEEVQKRLVLLGEREKITAQQLAEAKGELETCRQRKADLEPKLTELAHRLSALRKAQEEREQILTELRHRLVSKQREKESLQNTIWRLQNRLTEITQRRHLLIQRLTVEVELQPEELPPPPPRRLKSEEVESRLNLLKEKMYSLGELNFEAAAALEALKQREADILREKTDIAQTLTRLRSFLIELDKEAREKFLTALEAVRGQFTQLFQTFFSEGDTCDIVLLQPESPLTSDIDIIARPKGKRPLSLQQLSGGEKALVALALLFSAFAVRPSAICVLDEVDAPLDDVNAHKFGQLIRKMSAETPLMVITHNKITMSYCERLYGVTMPEAGVSTVLAVEMERASALAQAV